MSGIGPPTTFTELVRQTMAAHLVSGGFSAETIAKRIGLGVRTLQRRLESEGNSYRDIRSLVLCERARALLSETRMSVADIATALGFEEVNSFRRAFHGWTGMTPPEFIRRQNPLIFQSRSKAAE
jgi:AraC-like DNA-binding protein